MGIVSHLYLACRKVAYPIMTDPLDVHHALSGEQLLATVCALADDIGPRPPGSRAEDQAREYLREQLNAAGITDVEMLPFPTWDSWGWNVVPATVIALVANVLGRNNKAGAGLNALVAAGAVAELWNGLTSRRQLLQGLYPKRDTATLVARIAPQGDVQRRVVLIGHTDTNKHRPTFTPPTKYLFLQSGALLLAAMITNVIALLGRGSRHERSAKHVQTVAAGVLAYAVYTFFQDEVNGFVDGANDNASAVACTLGLGLHTLTNPLQNTEVWLAFTGAEEVGLLGTHALLDHYGDTLKDAYFIDFELVGAGDIAYVTRHSGFAYGMSYTPDPDSLRIADQVAAQYPDLNVTGRPMVINEEVRALRQRGYRGICLVGVGDDGWLPNWHQYTDASCNIAPSRLATAAHFAWGMLQAIDTDAQPNS